LGKTWGKVGDELGKNGISAGPRYPFIGGIDRLSRLYLFTPDYRTGTGKSIDQVVHVVWKFCKPLSPTSMKDTEQKRASAQKLFRQNGPCLFRRSLCGVVEFFRKREYFPGHRASVAKNVTETWIINEQNGTNFKNCKKRPCLRETHYSVQISLIGRVGMKIVFFAMERRASVANIKRWDKWPRLTRKIWPILHVHFYGF